MHKHGHRGIGLLVLAPIFYLLLPDRPVLAILLAGIMVIQELPDKDQGISWLEHRGTSHSLFSAALVGTVCGGIGWVAGSYVIQPLAGWLSTAATSANTPASWWGTRLATYDAPLLAMIGFVVGSGGILTHLMGDIITPKGLQLFRPFSKWQYNVSYIESSNPYANTGFFVLGLLVFGASLASALGYF